MSRAILSAAAWVLLASCSLATVDGPRTDSSGTPMPCTRDIRAIMIDGAVTVASVFVLLGYLVTTGGRGGSTAEDIVWIGGPAAAQLGFGASGLVGWHRVARCRRESSASGDGSIGRRRVTSRWRP